jgi:hypothetical protein
MTCGEFIKICNGVNMHTNGTDEDFFIELYNPQDNYQNLDLMHFEVTDVNYIMYLTDGEIIIPERNNNFNKFIHNLDLDVDFRLKLFNEGEL